MAKTKICMFLDEEVARGIKIMVAKRGLAGVSELVENWYFATVHEHPSRPERQSGGK